jgi:hypothetical protein
MNEEIKGVCKTIAEKASEIQSLMKALDKRYALIEFLHTHNISVEKNERFTCGPVGCNGKLVALRFNGVEHRVDTDMTIKEYFNLYIP